MREAVVWSSVCAKLPKQIKIATNDYLKKKNRVRDLFDN